MALFHVNPQTGVASSCSAQVNNCPFGDVSAHYGDIREARLAFEQRMATQTIPTLGRVNGRSAYERRMRAEASAPVRVEQLKDAQGYYLAMHAVKVPGSKIKVRHRGLFGSKEFRYYQTGKGITDRGWVKLDAETKDSEFVTHREFMREFFHAADMKQPKTISLKRGFELELHLPAASHVQEWGQNEKQELTIKRYADHEEGLRERARAKEEWELANSLQRKGFTPAELYPWLKKTYENLDERDRP